MVYEDNELLIFQQQQQQKQEQLRQIENYSSNSLNSSKSSSLSANSSTYNSSNYSLANSNSSSVTSYYTPNYNQIHQQVLDKRIPSEIIEMSNQFSMNYDHSNYMYQNEGQPSDDYFSNGKSMPISMPPPQSMSSYQSRSQPQQSPPASVVAHRRQKSLELLRALPNRNDIYNEDYQHPAMYQDQYEYQQQQQMAAMDPYQRQQYSPGRMYFDSYRSSSPLQMGHPGMRKMPIAMQSNNSMYSHPGISNSTSSLSKMNMVVPMGMNSRVPMGMPLNYSSTQLQQQQQDGAPKFNPSFIPQHSRNSSSASRLSVGLSAFEPSMRKSSTEINLRERRQSTASEHILNFTNSDNLTLPIRQNENMKDDNLPRGENKHLNFVQSDFDQQQRQISDYSKFLGLDEDQSRVPSRMPSKMNLSELANANVSSGNLSRRPSRLNLNVETVHPSNLFNTPQLVSNSISNSQEELNVSPPTINGDMDGAFMNNLSENFTSLKLNDDLRRYHDSENGNSNITVNNNGYSNSDKDDNDNEKYKLDPNPKEIIIIDDNFAENSDNEQSKEVNELESSYNSDKEQSISPTAISSKSFEAVKEESHDQSSQDQSSQDQSVNEVISATRSRSNSTSSVESSSSYNSIVRGSSGKFKVITSQERNSRIARDSVLLEVENTLTSKKSSPTPKEDYLAKLIHTTRNSPEQIQPNETSPKGNNQTSPNSKSEFGERYNNINQSKNGFILDNEDFLDQTQHYNPPVTASSYAYNDLVNQASVNNIDHEIIDDLQSLSNYSGESGFSSAYHPNGSVPAFASPMMQPEEYYNDFAGYGAGAHQIRPMRRSFVPNYPMMNPSFDQMSFIEDPQYNMAMNYGLMNGVRPPFQAAAPHPIYGNPYSPRMSVGPQQQRKPMPTQQSKSLNIADEKISKQVEDFITLRKLILSGQKSSEFRLKWVISLIEASRNKLYFYITIKGLPLKGQSNVNVIEQNKQQFYRSALTHLTKIVNDPETLQHKKEAADSHFIYASMLSGDLPGFAAKNHDKAFSYYYNSAKHGHIHATFKVGQYLESGVGCDLNPKRALQFFTRAAKLGDISAKFRLAMIFLNGELSQTRSIKFFDYLMEVSSNPASKGEEVGMASFELGKIYEGIYPNVENYEEDFIDEIVEFAPVDDSKALFFYSKSAKQDYIKAKVKLGKVYEFGELNRPRDAKQSLQWYNESKNDPEAALGMSRWYISGEPGVLARNHDKAFQWAQKAVESGIAEADYTMGTYFQMGIGCEKNPYEATIWFEKAAEKGHEIARSKIEDSGYVE